MDNKQKLRPVSQLSALPGWFENFIIVAIIGVIVHQITDEFSVIFGFSRTALNVIIVLGVFFDLLFSIEFVLRSLKARKNGSWKIYFQNQRGWIDLISSVPLLLLDSGPNFIFLLLHLSGDASAIGILNTLKTVKAIRITRVLRLVRIIKIFGKIQNTDSLVTQRHVATVSTMAVVSMVAILVIAQFLPLFRAGDPHDYSRKREEVILLDIQRLNKDLRVTERELKNLFTKNPNYTDLLYFYKKKKNGELLLIYESSEEAREKALPRKSLADSNFEFVLSSHIPHVEHARMNIFIISMIIGVVLVYLIFYTRIFAQNVGEPIFVMYKGLKEWDFNLEVTVLDAYKDEEIFLLAESFNHRWLPLKARMSEIRKRKNVNKSKLSVADVMNLKF
jgi:hypothetical protein